MEVHEGIPGDFLKNKRRKVRVKGEDYLRLLPLALLRCNRVMCIQTGMLLLRIMLAEPHRDLVAILHSNIGTAICIL